MMSKCWVVLPVKNIKGAYCVISYIGHCLTPDQIGVVAKTCRNVGLYKLPDGAEGTDLKLCDGTITFQTNAREHIQNAKTLLEHQLSLSGIDIQPKLWEARVGLSGGRSTKEDRLVFKDPRVAVQKRKGEEIDYIEI